MEIKIQDGLEIYTGDMPPKERNRKWCIIPNLTPHKNVAYNWRWSMPPVVCIQWSNVVNILKNMYTSQANV